MEAKRGSGYSGNRYVHDMEQAEAMRRSLRRLGSDARQTTSSTSDENRLTLEDIELAFRGLEEAKSERDCGNHQNALRLYQLSLEVLILFLKDEENFKRIPVDPSTVSNAASVALSAAEELKAQSPKSSASTTSQSPLVSRMISSLSAALSGLPKKAATSLGTGSSPAGSQESAVSKPSPSVSPASVKKKSTRSQPLDQKVQKGYTLPLISSSAGSKSGLSNRSNTSQKAGQATEQTSLKLGDPTKNKMYTAVLDDIYVQPESIQDTFWDDIAGLEDVVSAEKLQPSCPRARKYTLFSLWQMNSQKQSLQESAILPLVRPDLFTGLRRPQNILLWGVSYAVRERPRELECCSPSQSVILTLMGTLTFIPSISLPERERQCSYEPLQKRVDPPSLHALPRL